MKFPKYSLPSLILFLLAYLSTSRLAAQQDLTVTVTDIEQPDRGRLTILLFDDEEKFGTKLEAAAYRTDLSDLSASVTHRFRDLPAGTYAIMVFQDLNENGTIDKNWIGFPKEPLSAYRMTGLGKPTWKKASITLNGKDEAVELKLLNQ